jgi:CRP/FNR family cyclic AMP-dependent transcriptional regulator
VAEHTFWDMLERPAREALTEAGHKQILRDGQTYLLQGERGDRVCVIMEGRMKLSMISDYGDETVLDLLGPGDIVGAMDAIDRVPRVASAVAKGMTTVITFSGEQLSKIIDAYPGTGRVLLRVLNERLRASYELRGARRGSRHRMAALMYQVAARYGKATSRDGEVAINPPLTGEEFASMAGTSRGSAGRAMTWLQNKGVIRRDGRVIIVNWKGLRQALRDLGHDRGDDNRD